MLTVVEQTPGSQQKWNGQESRQEISTMRLCWNLGLYGKNNYLPVFWQKKFPPPQKYPRAVTEQKYRAPHKRPDSQNSGTDR